MDLPEITETDVEGTSHSSLLGYLAAGCTGSKPAYQACSSLASAEAGFLTQEQGDGPDRGWFCPP